MKRSFAVVSLAASILAVAATAHARPRGGYTRISPQEEAAVRSEAEGPVVRAATVRTIYLNRHGGVFTYGPNNSSENVTSINGGNVSPFARTDEDWNKVLRCVQLQFGPFGARVTDVDPGDAIHIEAVIGGSPSQLGLPATVGGIAPFGCSGVIERAIVYAFASQYGADMQGLCETAAQEIAHALGLDHELLCEDPMTYLEGCGAKTFQDVSAPCGESSPRNCACGGTVQNSVDRLNATLGAPEVTPPVVSVTTPAEGDEVKPLFSITADASDDYVLRHAELWIDGELVRADETQPYEFQSGPELEPGTHSVEVRVYDAGRNMTSHAVNVTLVPECEDASDCAEGELCFQFRCVGDIGAGCALHTDCGSSLCGTRDEVSQCTQACSASDACPDGFQCVTGQTGGTGTCWTGGGGGGFCQIAVPSTRTAGTGLLALLALGSVGLLVRFRRARA